MPPQPLSRRTPVLTCQPLSHLNPFPGARRSASLPRAADDLALIWHWAPGGPRHVLAGQQSKNCASPPGSTTVPLTLPAASRAHLCSGRAPRAAAADISARRVKAWCLCDWRLCACVIHLASVTCLSPSARSPAPVLGQREGWRSARSSRTRTRSASLRS